MNCDHLTCLARNKYYELDDAILVFCDNDIAITYQYTGTIFSIFTHVKFWLENAIIRTPWGTKKLTLRQTTNGSEMWNFINSIIFQCQNWQVLVELQSIMVRKLLAHWKKKKRFLMFISTAQFWPQKTWHVVDPSVAKKQTINCQK
jgi:hypothetical protein